MSIVNKTVEKAADTMLAVATNEELTKRLAKLTVEFVEFRSSLKAQENINQKLEDKISEQDNKISEQDKEIEKLKKRIEMLESENELLKRKIRTLEYEIEILENENKILKSEIKLTEFYT